MSLSIANRRLGVILMAFNAMSFIAVLSTQVLRSFAISPNLKMVLYLSREHVHPPSFLPDHFFSQNECFLLASVLTTASQKLRRVTGETYSANQKKSTPKKLYKNKQTLCSILLRMFQVGTELFLKCLLNVKSYH